MAFICEKNQKIAKRQKKNVENANEIVDFKEWI